MVQPPLPTAFSCVDVVYAPSHPKRPPKQLATADVNVNLNIRRPGFGINHRKHVTSGLGAPGPEILYVVAIGHHHHEPGEAAGGIREMSRLFEFFSCELEAGTNWQHRNKLKGILSGTVCGVRVNVRACEGRFRDPKKRNNCSRSRNVSVAISMVVGGPSVKRSSSESEVADVTGTMLHISFRPACGYGYRTWAPLCDILRASKHRRFDQSWRLGSKVLAYPRKRGPSGFSVNIIILRKFLRSSQKER